MVPEHSSSSQWMTHCGQSPLSSPAQLPLLSPSGSKFLLTVGMPLDPGYGSLQKHMYVPMSRAITSLSAIGKISSPALTPSLWFIRLGVTKVPASYYCDRLYQWLALTLVSTDFYLSSKAMFMPGISVKPMDDHAHSQTLESINLGRIVFGQAWAHMASKNSFILLTRVVCEV